MKFEWDEVKNRSNIRKHGFDFADAPEIFRGPLLALPNTREDYGEDRWVAIGLLRNRVVVLAFAQPAEDVIRIISLRKADRDERKEFEKAIKDELGSD
jgi:uncharacterized DUF497 family protein